jgi:hypothetical protein
MASYSIRQRIATVAVQLDGLCACEPTRKRFAETLGKPPCRGAWPLSVAFEMKPKKNNGEIVRAANGQPIYQTRGISTCMMILVHGIWKPAGLAVPSTLAGCYSGGIDRKLQAYARERQAIVEGNSMKWVCPTIGDALVLRSGDGAHLCTIVSEDMTGPDAVFDTIDGGQVCRTLATDPDTGRATGHQGIGLQAIKLRPGRKYEPATATKPAKLDGREVLYWIDAESLPEAPKDDEED